METRAPFIIVGAFVLAAIGAVFGFVYWLHNTAGTGARTCITSSSRGPSRDYLLAQRCCSMESASERSPIWVWSPTARGRWMRPSPSHQVLRCTSDTKVGLDFQGLTGVPVITLEGGKEVGASTDMKVLVADPAAGQSMTQAARNALGRVDSVLAENAEPLKSTIANLKIFSEGLAKNTGGLDSIVAGLVKMTGGGEPAIPKTVYDLSLPSEFASPRTPLNEQLVMPDTDGDPAAGHPAIPDCAEQGPSGISRTRNGPTAFRRCCRQSSFRASKTTISPMRHSARWTIREQTLSY